MNMNVAAPLHSVNLVSALFYSLVVVLLVTCTTYDLRDSKHARRLSDGEQSRNNCNWVAWKKQLVCSGDTPNTKEISRQARPKQKLHSPLGSRDSLDDAFSVKPSRLRNGKSSSSTHGEFQKKKIHGTSLRDRDNIGGSGGDNENDGHDMSILRCTGAPGPLSVAALVPELAAEFRWAQAGNPLRARAFSAIEVERIELKYSQQLKAQPGRSSEARQRTRGCLPLPAWVGSKSSGGSFGQSPMSEVFRRLPAMMHNRTVVFVGDSQSAALHLDLAWAVEVNTGLTPYRRTNSLGAACSIWLSTSFAVCSLRAGNSHGGSTLRLSAYSTDLTGGGAAAFSPSWRTTALSDTPPAAAVQRSSKKLRSRISSGTRSSSKGLLTPPVCEGLAKLSASHVAAHALKDVVMCLGALLPQEVGGLSPRNTIVASSSTGLTSSGAAAGGGARNRIAGPRTADEIDHVEELMEWYQSLEPIVRPTLLWRESLPTHYAPSILHDGASVNGASAAAERAKQQAGMANSNSAPGEWSPILLGSCRAIHLAVMQDSMKSNNNRSSSSNKSSTTGSSSSSSTSVSGKGRKETIAAWSDSHPIATSPPSAQITMHDPWKNSYQGKRVGQYLQAERRLRDISNVPISSQLQNHAWPLNQPRLLSATSGTDLNDHNPYAVYKDPLAAWRTPRPRDGIDVIAANFVSDAHANANTGPKPFKMISSSVSMPRPLRSSGSTTIRSTNSMPRTHDAAHSSTSSPIHKPAAAEYADGAVPAHKGINQGVVAAKKARKRPVFQSGCAPLSTMDDFNSSSGNSWSASSQSFFFISGGRGGDSGTGMQSANAKNLPAVRKAGVPVVSLWAATAPFWDLHAGCPPEDSSPPSSSGSHSHSGSSSSSSLGASPDCTSWPYPSPVLRFANLQVIAAISRMVTLQSPEKKISAPTSHNSDSFSSMLRPELESATGSKSNSGDLRQNTSQQRARSVVLPPIRHPFGRKPRSSGAPLARAFAAPTSLEAATKGEVRSNTALPGLSPLYSFVERGVDTSRLVASRAFAAAKNLFRSAGGYFQT